jgi:hypothetical protein
LIELASSDLLRDTDGSVIWYHFEMVVTPWVLAADLAGTLLVAALVSWLFNMTAAKWSRWFTTRQMQ